MWVWTPRIYFYILLNLKVLLNTEFSLLVVLEIFVYLFPTVLHNTSFHCGIFTHILFLFVPSTIFLLCSSVLLAVVHLNGHIFPN